LSEKEKKSLERKLDQAATAQLLAKIVAPSGSKTKLNNEDAEPTEKAELTPNQKVVKV
jgi:hypothetical protein